MKMRRSLLLRKAWYFVVWNFKIKIKIQSGGVRFVLRWLVIKVLTQFRFPFTNCPSEVMKLMRGAGVQAGWSMNDLQRWTPTKGAKVVIRNARRKIYHNNTRIVSGILTRENVQMEVKFEVSNDEDRKKWILHNPWLQNQWKESNLEIDEFVKTERARIDASIRKMAKSRTSRRYLSFSGWV